MNLNLVVVGTSIISDYFIDALKQTRGFTLYGVFSRSLEKAQAMATRHQAPKAYAEWSTLLEDPAVDVVYVATPNDLHAPHSIQLMEAGKHVICEKPYVLNLAEFTQVQAVSERTQRFCFDAITTLHLPNLEHARSALQHIQPIKLFSSAMVQYSSRYDALLENTLTNIFDPNHGGGALMDLGVYPITLAVALFGTPISIHYEANCIPNGIDTSGVLVMDYGTFKASLVVGKDSHGPNATHIAGEKGHLHLPMQPSRFTGVELLVKNASTQLGVEQVPNPMVYEIQAFADIVAANDWPRYRKLMTLTQQVIEILDEGRSQIGLRFPSDTPTSAA
jgi:predicted dehydrogenase